MLLKTYVLHNLFVKAEVKLKLIKIDRLFPYIMYGMGRSGKRRKCLRFFNMNPILFMEKLFITDALFCEM